MKDTAIKKSGHFAYEADVKQYILDHRELFLTSTEQATATFEKAICRGKVITDCMLFGKNTGVVGIEIKTAHDSKKRLANQLAHYNKVCDYVYVLVHDLLYDEILSLVNTTKCQNVGIITYTEAKGKLFAGIMRQASYNKHQVQDTIDMLWWVEIKYMVEQLAKKHDKRMIKCHSKRQMENYLVHTYGALEVEQLMISNYLNDIHALEKDVKLYQI